MFGNSTLPISFVLLFAFSGSWQNALAEDGIGTPPDQPGVSPKTSPTDKTPPPAASISNYALQLEYNELFSEQEGLASDITLIQAEEDKFKQVIQNINALTDASAYHSEFQTGIMNVSNALMALNATFDTNSPILSLNSEEVNGFKRAFMALNYIGTDKLNDNVSSIQDVLYNGYNSSESTRRLYNIAQAAGRMREKSDEILPKATRLFDRLGGGASFGSPPDYSQMAQGQTIKIADITLLTKDALAEISNANLLEKFEKHFQDQKTAWVNWLQKINECFANEKQSKQKTLSSDQKRLADLDAQMKAGQQAQLSINDKLIYTVYAVIGAVISLFFLLRLLPLELAKIIIETRTLFETVSLAFLVVTLIILGIGQKINAETLGTLLGTIAGYIFGKQSNKPSPPNS